MNYKKYIFDLTNATTEVRFLRLLLFISGVIILVGSVAIVKLIGAEKTILVPPEINRSFWVSGSAVSKEYLEEMAYWYAGLALNISPQIADYQTEMFLKFSAPAEEGRLRAAMGAKSEFLRKNNTATQFSTRTIASDEKAMKVALSGTLITWVADKKAGERNVTFMVGFKYLNGKLYVSDFKETSDQNPFDRPPPPKS